MTKALAMRSSDFSSITTPATDPVFGGSAGLSWPAAGAAAPSSATAAKSRMLIIQTSHSIMQPPESRSYLTGPNHVGTCAGTVRLERALSVSPLVEHNPQKDRRIHAS